jgi:signal transduction histidine kinase
MKVIGSAAIGIMHKRVFWDLLLTNLLSNAVYHAGNSGRVEVQVTKEEDGSGRVDISNEGLHIPKGEIARVFNPGYSTKEGGRGLGLYVAQEIAHGLGGKILPPMNEQAWFPFGRKRVTFSIVDLPIVDLAEVVEK